MLLVIIGHIPYFYEEYNNTVGLTSYLQYYTPFYMAAFFFITGFCSTKKKNTQEQIKNDFSRIIFPCIVVSSISWHCVTNKDIYVGGNFICSLLLYGGSYWFLPAMVLSKVIYKTVIISLKTNRTFVSLILSLVGFILFSFVPSQYNVWHIFQALIFIQFIHFGYKFRSLQINEDYTLLICGIIYILTLILNIKMNLSIFGICAICSVNIYCYPLWIVMALSGSIMFFLLFKKNIVDLNVFTYVGKNSMFFYILQYSGAACYFSIFGNMAINIILQTIALLGFVFLWCFVGTEAYRIFSNSIYRNQR